MRQPRLSNLIVALAGPLLLGLATPLHGDEANGAATVKPPNAAAVQTASPLAADIEDGKARLAAMEKEIQDYSCTFFKRERVDGKLLDYETMFVKVRHKPFSVHMNFLAPNSKKGQQVVYVEGQNGGNLLAQPVGIAGKLGPFSLPPTGYLAMQGQRYPITEFGFVNLTRRLIEVGSLDMQHPADNTVVKHYDDVKVKGGNGGQRICRLTEVIHPQMRPGLRYHVARIYIDKERNIPIRFESYLWPTTPGGKPELLEEYTYLDVKLNNGFTDSDFQIVKD